MADKSTLFKCTACNAYFLTMEVAERHSCGRPNHDNTVQHNIDGSSNDIQESDTDATFIQCDKCDGWFRSKEDFDRHSCCSNRSQQPSTSENEGHDDRGNWGRAETLLLIDQYIKFKEKVDNGYLRKKQLWQKISEKLKAEKFRYTSDQVSSRWKTLVRSYKSVKDHNGKSGNSPKTHEYQSELDEIFEQDPCVTPTVTLSSSTSKRKNDGSRESGQESENDGGSTSTTPASKKCRTSSKSSSQEMLTLMHNYMEDQAAIRQEEIQRRERMHRERIDTMRSLIDTMKEAYQSK